MLSQCQAALEEMMSHYGRTVLDLTPRPSMMAFEILHSRGRVPLTTANGSCRQRGNRDES